MPYRISEAPQMQFDLWPHQSMTPAGFVTFMGVTMVLVAVPLLSVLGTPVLWGLLPFFVVALSGLWLAIDRNRKDARLTETLRIWPDRMELVRQESRGAVRRWEANPHWVSVHLHTGGAPVEKYLTLKGGGREVEFGAFLSPDEREDLYHELRRRVGPVAQTGSL